MKVSVTFDWRDIGEVRLAGSALVFPALMDEPGVYRFGFSGHRADGSYVGAALLSPIQGPA